MGMGNLQILTLRKNRIKLLDEELFAETKKLTELLYFDDNDLTAIHKGLFIGLTNLEILYLDKNQIDTLAWLDEENLAET